VAEWTGGADPGSPAIRYEGERPSARASSPFTMDWQFTRPGVAASRRRHGIAVQQYLSSR
jgi:hypothetical protein